MLFDISQIFCWSVDAIKQINKCLAIYLFKIIFISGVCLIHLDAQDHIINKGWMNIFYHYWTVLPAP